LRPSPTEFLIDPADGYPDILAGLLDTPDQLGAGLARAAQQILTGNGLRDPKTGTAAGSLIRVTRSWRPEEVRVWTNQRELEQAGSFELRTSAQDLLEEGRRWADDDGRLIGRYVHQSLADALSTEPDRLGRFRRALGMALRASQPLIQMDPAFQRLDPTFTGSPPRPMITAIPLAPGTAAYEAALETLINHGDIPEEVASTAFDSAGSNEIEIATFLSRSTHPAAFFSLTDPILRNWSRHGAQGRRSEFVRWRRARALPRATPMTSAARRDLVRGFLIALVDDLVAPATDGQQVVVTDPDSARQFPCTLLGPAPDAGDPFDWLGAIVESLALLCVAVISDPPSMHAYQTLVLLGRNRRLRMEPAAALGRLKKLRETAIQRYPLVGSPHQRRRAWDLRADIHTELDALVRQAGGEE